MPVAGGRGADPSRIAELIADPEKLGELLDHARDLEERLELLERDHADLTLIHDTTIEHSTEIEEELAQKIEEAERLANDLEKRNGFIRGLFGRYMTDEVVEALLASPEGTQFGGESRKVTILMSDLRGFTSFCERLEPPQVVGLLNIYLGRMAEIIGAYHGTINEFIGDAILAVFGAPVHWEDAADRAVAAAVAMQNAMGEVNDICRQQGLPDLEMGIGIHTGVVVVGNIGSTQRAKYGLVGSPVNLTSRIESYTVGGQIFVSDATLQEAGGRAITRSSFEVQAKGVRHPIRIWEVCGIGGEHAIQLQLEEEDLPALSSVIPLRIVLLDGKDVRGDPFDGRITRLSPKRAVVEVGHDLDAHHNLKIEIPGCSDPIYAKVVAVEGPRVATLRFTSVPPAARARLSAFG